MNCIPVILRPLDVFPRRFFTSASKSPISNSVPCIRSKIRVFCGFTESRAIYSAANAPDWSQKLYKDDCNILSVEIITPTVSSKQLARGNGRKRRH